MYRSPIHYQIISIYSSSLKHTSLYDSSFDSLIAKPSVTISPFFLGHLHSVVLKSSAQYVDNSFNFYIPSTFSDLCLVFIDGSVSLISAVLMFISLSIVHTKVLPKFVFLFSAEEHAVIQMLYLLKLLSVQKYLIITNSQFLLFLIHSNLLKSSIPTLIFVFNLF